VHLPVYHIGHFLNQPDNPTGFAITCFSKMAEPEVEDRHKHTFYEIIWVETGACRQLIDYQEYAVAPETLFFISPGQVHQFEEWQHVTGGSILFTEAFFLLNQQNKDALFELSFLDNRYAKPLVQPDAASYQSIRQLIALLQEEYRRPDASARVEQALLHALLGQIQRSVDVAEGRCGQPDATGSRTAPFSAAYLVLYKRFKRLLDQHCTEALTPGDYADRLAVTPHHLNHVVKRITGTTASAVVRARAMLEAKRLLTFTDLTITEVAARLSLFDSSYFAKIFRAETGTSPLAFRQAISESYRKGSVSS
jgi:AraC family transcriptional regulator, transcriptional activator of pobA